MVDTGCLNLWGYDVRQSKRRERRLHWVAPGSSCDRQPAAGVPPPLSLSLSPVWIGAGQEAPVFRVSLFFENQKGLRPLF